MSFAASPPATPRLIESELYEQHGYAQSSQYRQVKKRRWGGFFLLVIVVCILFLFGIGMYKLVRIANPTSTIKQANTPSGNVLVPAAAAILKDAQTSSDIDNTLAPTQVTKTFMANQKVYVTFTIASGKQDGSIEAKWYEDGQVIANTILPHMHENTHGVFSNIYISATPDGAVELYWCTQPDCKDAQLAQVVHFVVTPVDTASSVPIEYSEQSATCRIVFHVLE